VRQKVTLEKRLEDLEACYSYTLDGTVELKDEVVYYEEIKRELKE
jgi:hypothetical protein